MSDGTATALADALRDRYVLERPLGRGGMATVYLAQDLRHDRPVALKVLLPELATTLGPERFQREIRLAARLQHPHILTVLDSGESAGQLWFTMPLVEGESLRARLVRERQLPLDDALRITREVASALDYAHRHDVIHRDVKPENVLLTAEGDTLVADFGIARALSAGEERLTETGLAVGTPAYMSPEQAAGERTLDARTDVYSLGVVLYEMLAGEPPYTGPTAQAILARRFSEAPRPLRTLRETIPEAIEQAVQKALARTPADRFSTAAQFAQALTPTATTPTATPSVVPPLETVLAPARSAPTALAAHGRFPVGLTLLGLGFLIGLGVLFAWRRSHPGLEPSGSKMLVVLPLKNLGRPEDQYFADGLTEEITSRLAGLSGLGVISRTTADQYRNTTKSAKQIGQELAAGYVLEGSVRWERDPVGRGRVRVTPQLIQVSNDSHLWASRYDADLADVFQVQAQIGEQVAGALDVVLRPQEREALVARPTNNPDAYDAYLRANDYHNRVTATDDAIAIQLYERALTLDSTFAAAWARLAQAQAAFYWFYWDRSPERLVRARQAAERAVALQPALAEAHLAMGFYYYWGRRDYERALAEFALAQQGQPNNAELAEAIGYVERRQGRWNEAVTSLKRAAVLDPRAAETALSLGETYLLVRAYPEAERALDRAIALEPDLGFAYWEKMRLYANGEGSLSKAQSVLAQALRQMSLGKFMSQARQVPLLGLVASDESHRVDLANLPPDQFGNDVVHYYLLKAQAYRFQGQSQLARSYYDSLAAATTERLRTLPDDAFLHAFLGLADAYRGDRAEALREGRRAADLLPPSRDAYTGVDIVVERAEIYAAVGQADSAVSLLQTAVAVPSQYSASGLKADPTWAPLRGNGRFERLVAGK